jgi:hypothetical protein
MSYSLSCSAMLQELALHAAFAGTCRLFSAAIRPSRTFLFRCSSEAILEVPRGDVSGAEPIPVIFEVRTIGIAGVGWDIIRLFSGCAVDPPFLLVPQPEALDKGSRLSKGEKLAFVGGDSPGAEPI